MFRPHRRVVVLHVTIILGAFVIGLLGTPLALFVLMVLVKTALDLRLHLEDHRRAQSLATTRRLADPGRRAPQTS